MLKSRILAAALSLSLLLSTSYSVFADNEDTASDNAVQAEETVTAEVETAAAPIKTVTIPQDIKAPILALGIMTEAEMSLNDLITRSFAAEVIVRMTGFDTSLPANGTVYKDVTQESLYAYSIEQATDMKYFAGVGDGYFLPDGNITDRQMATVLLRFAGYEGKIQIDEFYWKLAKGVNAADDVTYKDLVYLIYNFLDLGTLNLVSVSTEGNAYKINEDKTILNDWFSTYMAEGIIKKTGKTALFSATNIAEDEVSISTASGMLTIKQGNTEIAKELGKYVKVYYKIEDKTNNLVCIGYVVSEGRNKIVEFSINDLDCSASTGIELSYYDENGRIKKLPYSGGAVIYNEYCYPISPFSPSVLANKEGTICAIDNNSDNIYDVIYIEAYEAHRVKSVILSTNTIIFKDGGSIDLNDDHFEEYTIKYADGVKAYLEDFNEDFVVSVALGGKTAKVIVSDITKEGIVTETDINDAGNRIVTIDQEDTYRIIGSTFNEAGKGVRLFVTFLGNVIDIETMGNVGFQFGFLAKFKYEKKDDKLYIKILNTSNQYEEFMVSEKLRVDGVTYRNTDDMKTALEAPQDSAGAYEVAAPGGVTPLHRYPIRYRCNENGVLLEIDTPHIGGSEDRHNSLHNYYYDINDGNSTSYRWGYMNNYVLGFETPVTPSTVFFNIVCTEKKYEATSTDYDPWSWNWTQETFDNTAYTSVSTAKNLASTYATRNIRYYAYRCDSDNENAELILTISGPGNSTNNTSLFMYEKSFQAYDEENDEIITKFVGYKEGVRTEIAVMPEYLTDSKIAGISKGDVITFGTDAFGRISGVWEIVKHSTATNPVTSLVEKALLLRSVRDANGNDTIVKRLDSNDKKMGNSIAYGYVLDRTNDLICVKNIDLPNVGNDKNANTVLYSDLKSDPSGSDKVIWIRVPASTPVTVYSPNSEEEVHVGTYDEILGGAKKSFIAIRYGSNTTIQEIVVLNEDF